MQQTLNPLVSLELLDRRLEAPTLFRLWHLSSLDAPAVATVWSLGFAKATGVQLPEWVPVLLFLVTWCVYISDRLLDARAAFRARQIHRLRERHHFHWQHRRVFFPLALVAACIGTWIVLSFMPCGARERNALLALAGVTYFSIVHIQARLLALLPKELLVALLFTMGCVLPTLGRIGTIPSALVTVIVFFVVLAWLNCHAIERWESVSETFSGLQIRTAAGLLAMAGLIGAIILFAEHSNETVLLGAGAASAAMLAVLDRIRGRLTPLTLRTAADLLLLTPLVLLLR